MRRPHSRGLPENDCPGRDSFKKLNLVQDGLCAAMEDEGGSDESPQRRGEPKRRTRVWPTGRPTRQVAKEINYGARNDTLLRTSLLKDCNCCEGGQI
jgi:hypothetical protein